MALSCGAWTFDLMREHESLIVRLATKLFYAGWLSGGEIDALWRNNFAALCRSKHNASNARFAVQSDSIGACLIAGFGATLRHVCIRNGCAAYQASAWSWPTYAGSTAA